MTTRAAASRYTLGEEIANSVTHGVGGLLAIAGLAVVTTFAALKGDAWHVVACSVYGATLVVLYTSSTLYHSIQAARAKAVFRAIDHSAIFLLIAGTYTPFTLVNLRGPWGWTLFGVIWGLAALGVVFQVSMLRRWPALQVLLYIGMGWVVLVAAKPLVAAIPVGGLALLVAGGLAYTGGVAFYAWRSLPYHHAIWHLFVLAGSALHFFAILFYVVPVSS